MEKYEEHQKGVKLLECACETNVSHIKQTGCVVCILVLCCRAIMPHLYSVPKYHYPQSDKEQQNPASARSAAHSQSKVSRDEAPQRDMV